MKVKLAQLCLTLCDLMDCSPWNSLGQNTGVDSPSLLQGIFPTQGLNPGLLHCRKILYQLSHEGSPRILEWVAYPFSSGFSQPRNQIGVSCTADRFFTNWAVREAQSISRYFYIWFREITIQSTGKGSKRLLFLCLREMEEIITCIERDSRF